MGDSYLVKAKQPETKDERTTLSGADFLNLGLAALQALGGSKTDAALLALKAANPKQLEALLPALLICMTPFKPVNAGDYRRRAKIWFKDNKEGMDLANKKADGKDFTPAEEANLLVLTRAAIYKLAKDKGGIEKLDTEDFKELTRCNKAILDRDSWSKEIDDTGIDGLRYKLNKAYLEEISLIAKSVHFENGIGRTGKKLERGVDKKDTEGGGYNTLVDFLQTVIDHKGDVNAKYKDAVLGKDDDGKVGPIIGPEAKKLHDEMKALTVEEVLYYLALGNEKRVQMSHGDQIRERNALATNAHHIRRSGEGGSDNPDEMLRPRKPPDSGPKREGLFGFLEEAAPEATWWYLSGFGGTLGGFELISTAYGLKAGNGKYILPITRGVGKGVFYSGPKWAWDKYKGTPDANDPAVRKRLVGETMYNKRVRENFKGQAESTIKGLDIAADRTAAGEKVGKFLTEFASEVGLDPRIKKNRLKIAVEFSSDPVVKTAGMLKGALSSIETTDGVATIKITFPADIGLQDLGRDCHSALYQVARHRQGPRGAFSLADHGAVRSMVESLGELNLGESRSGSSVSEAMAGRTPAPTHDPVHIIFDTNYISINGQKYGVSRIAKYLKDAVDERFDEVKKSKKKGDREYDAAEEDCKEIKRLVVALDSRDQAAQQRAEETVMKKAQQRFIDGVEGARRARAMAQDDRARALSEDPGARDAKTGKYVALLLFAEKWATPVALAGLGVSLGASSARASESSKPVKPAELEPLVEVKKKKR